MNLFKNLKNWWVYPAHKFRLIRSYPVLFKLRNSVSLEVHKQTMNVFKEIIMDECYMKGLTELSPEMPLTILDVGANVGCYSLFMASRYPLARIIAFEPMKENYKFLSQNFQKNPDKNLVCENIAVFGQSGKITLKYIPQESFPTRASIFKYQSFWDEIEVPCLSLPDIFRKFGIFQIDLLKLDCEGAEYNILYSLPAEYFNKISQIVAEVHPGLTEKANIDELEKHLKKNGYETRTGSESVIWASRM
ncbi:MAG: FkbM family methyltransferase [Candidatus Aureabacteria bacterium]|nr:FkbM family methyltransferase [Candidatus Auribacterota bacterium]